MRLWVQEGGESGGRQAAASATPTAHIWGDAVNPRPLGQHPACGQQHGTPPGLLCPGRMTGAALVHEARSPRASAGAAAT